MKKHAKKALRSVLAFAMAVVLLATSLPIAFAAGTYDPTPVFSEDATLWAWVTDDGDVQVIYPQATPNTDYISDKHIATYYITLYDLGPMTEVHNDPATETVPQAQIVVDASASAFALDGTGTVTFTAATLANKGVTLDDTHRFSVEVLAQDSTGWVSEPLTTIVSDVPQFVYDEESYNPLTENATGMREVIMMEAANNDGVAYVSGSGTASNGANYRQRVADNNSTWTWASRWADGALDYIADSSTGTNQLTMLGMKEQAGAENSDAGVDTSAYGFRVNATGDQSFATTWSRQHWDLTGAEEVWYWFDLSQVSVQDLAFELKSQGKRYEEYYWSSGIGKGIIYLYGSANDDDYSTVTYSTKGYTGDDGYVLIQADDGSWQTVPLEDGGIDLAGYKGYIRVPIQFICSTTPTYVEARNDNWGFGGNGLADDLGNNNEAGKKAAFDNNVLLNEKVLVDPAGTPISQALLIQYRQLSIDKTVDEFLGIGQGDADRDNGNPNNNVYTMPHDTDYAADYATLEKPYWGASTLASGSSIDNVSNNTSDPNRAYVQTTGTNTVVKDGDGNAVIVNRENGYKAIQDIAGAGFSYTSMSADSVNKSFFMDSVMTYKSSGSYPNDMTEGEYGYPLSDYYDQRVEIPRSILQQISTMITTPDLGDYRAVQYIEEMLDGYRTAYAGVGNDFLSEDNLAATAATLGMSDVWQNFLDARTACINGGTIKDNDDGTYTYLPNNKATDLVPVLIRSLEKLPDPGTVASVSDTLESEIVRLWQIYRRLNLTQLDAMSNEEEQKMLEYAALASDAINEELLIGQAMADNAFVAFNTLDNANTARGQEAYRLENDVNAAAGANSGANSYRFTKGLLGYTTSLYNFHGASAVDNDESGRDATTDGMDVSALRAAGADVVITGNGAANTNGATVLIDNSFAGEYNVVSVSKDSLDTSDAASMYNNRVASGLGDLAAVKNSGVNSSFPLGLVFYVDFSEISNFYMTATISTVVNGTALDFAFNPGAEQSWQTFYLMNEATGEWVQVQGSGNASAVVESSGVTNSAGVDLQLDGYKGFVMLPLYHFKQTINQRDNAMLDESAEALNNIWRVSIGIAPRDSSAAAAMDGHSFTVDTIGFGYNNSADAYGDHGHQTFGEQYGVKTFRAAAFEEVVAALEPQAGGNAFDSAFKEAANAAKAQYDALSAYEQNLPSTQNAYAILNRYLTDIANNNTADYAPAESPLTIYNVSFPALGLSGTLAVADGNTSGEYDLPYPGVTDTDGDGRADAANYGAYGLTAETAAQIIEWYNTSYSRWTEEQKNQSPEMRRQFLNAYNAAMRCYTTLEGLLADSNTFLNELYNPADASTSLFRTLSEIYYEPDAEEVFLGTAGDGKVYDYNKNTPYGTHTTVDGVKVNEGNYISITDTKALDHISKTYRSQMNYYAKHLLVAGQLQEGVKNIPNAVRKLVYNSYSTDRHGDPFTGGIWTLYNRYLTLYNNAKAKINAGTALTDEELADLKLATDEYEMLLPTYHDVAELYDLIQQIYDLFPVVTSTLTATGSSPSTNQTILLSYDGEAAAVENKIDPVYTLTQFEQYLTDLDGTGTLTMTSQNGGLLKSADGTESLAYEFTYGGRTAVFSGGAIEIGSYSAPMSAGIAMHVKISDPQAFPMELSDVVTLTYTYQYTDRFGILREATDVKTVTIRYATDDMYVVEVPAEVEIPWGSDSVKASYVVTCNLNEGSTIDVGITPAAARFDLSANGTAETISCTADSPAAATYSGTQIEATATNPMTISIDASEWQNIPVAAYRADDQITYTVTYTDGSATP